MLSQIIRRWFQLYRKSNKFNNNDFDVFVISGNYTKNTIPSVLNKYFSQIDINKTIQDFTFRDLFFGGIHFAGHPTKKNLSGMDKIKRALIRTFFVNYEKAAEIWNLVDTIFLPSDDLNIYLPGQHVIDIYKKHLPDFKINDLTGYFSSFRNFLIYFLACISCGRFCDKKKGITVFANIISPSLLKAYKVLHPQKSVVIRFHDRLSFVSDNPVKVKNILDKLIRKNVIAGAESYSESEATLLGIQYRPNAVNADVVKRVDYSYRDYLYTFIGAYKSVEDKSRLNDLEIIRKKLSSIFSRSSEYINEHMVNVNNFNNERISYDDYLEIMGKSEILIDMYRIDPYEGFSFRIPEALMLNRKVITNRLVILECDFYDPSRFFIIGHDPIDRIEEFVKGDYKPLSKEITGRYDCRNWWKNDVV